MGILAGILAWAAGFDSLACAVIVSLLAGVWIALPWARRTDDGDGFAQQRMADDGAPIHLGDWPFTRNTHPKD